MIQPGTLVSPEFLLLSGQILCEDIFRKNQAFIDQVGGNHQKSGLKTNIHPFWWFFACKNQHFHIYCG